MNHHQSIQIVAQSLLTHTKNSLILEELRWFNLVNASGNLPTLLQVTLQYIYVNYEFDFNLILFLSGILPSSYLQLS